MTLPTPNAPEPRRLDEAVEKRVDATISKATLAGEIEEAIGGLVDESFDDCAAGVPMWSHETIAAANNLRAAIAVSIRQARAEALTDLRDWLHADDPDHIRNKIDELLARDAKEKP